MNYRLNGTELVTVINTDLSLGIDGIVAQKNIQSIEDLKGKKVGISSNTYGEYLLSVVLKRSRMTMKDVVLVEEPAEKTIEAILENRVDAIVTWEPFISDSIKKGSGGEIV